MITALLEIHNTAFDTGLIVIKANERGNIKMKTPLIWNALP